MQDKQVVEVVVLVQLELMPLEIMVEMVEQVLLQQ
jgi:hypothetical protein